MLKSALSFHDIMRTCTTYKNIALYWGFTSLCAHANPSVHGKQFLLAVH